jgi:hypothetical protein
MKIKVYTGYKEYSNTHLYTWFEIVPYLPEIGDDINGWEVTGIFPAYLDCEQGSDEVYSYDYYEIETVNTTDSTDTMTLFYAIEKPDEPDDLEEEN